MYECTTSSMYVYMCVCFVVCIVTKIYSFCFPSLYPRMDMTRGAEDSCHTISVVAGARGVGFIYPTLTLTLNHFALTLKFGYSFLSSSAYNEIDLDHHDGLVDGFSKLTLELYGTKAILKIAKGHHRLAHKGSIAKPIHVNHGKAKVRQLDA